MTTFTKIEITLRYIEQRGFRWLTRQDKEAMLKQLEIDPVKGEEPLMTWTVAMCKENGLDSSKKRNRQKIGAIALTIEQVRLFIWNIA